MPKIRGAKNIIHEQMEEEKPFVPSYINTRAGYLECKNCHSWYNSLVASSCPRCKNPHEIDIRATVDGYEKKYARNKKSN